MRRWIVLLVVSVLIGSMATGCRDKNQGPKDPKETTEQTAVVKTDDNNAFKMMVQDTDVDPLGVIVNMPEENELKKVAHLETYEQSESLESFIAIPKYNGTKVQVISLEYADDTLKEKETLYNKDNTEDGFGLLVKAQRPEGSPNLKIRMEYKGKRAEYIVSYNGKDGNPKFEYISVKWEALDVDTKNTIGEQIVPIRDDNYTEGLNLFNKYEYDFNKDGQDETIEVYCAAELDEQGTPILDDGQEWSLIIRRGEQIYPIFERKYIQLGKIDYSTFESYDDNTIHLLIECSEGASISIYDCSYNLEIDTFNRAEVYSAQNINLINKY